jgi:hypothetical protein
MRVSALDQDIGLGAHNEEGRAKREDVKTLEIHVAAIHDVEGPSLRRNLVEDVDVMHFAVGNAAAMASPLSLRRQPKGLTFESCLGSHFLFTTKLSTFWLTRFGDKPSEWIAEAWRVSEE